MPLLSARSSLASPIAPFIEQPMQRRASSLKNGRITTLDPKHPEASELVIADGRIAGVDNAEDFPTRPGHEGHRPPRPPRHPRPERLAPAPHPRRAELQHGAALGRRAVAGRRPADAQGAGPPHAAAAVGAGRRRLERVPVRRAAHADARRDQRRRARHAGLRPAPLRPRAAQPRGAAGVRLHEGHARIRRAARSSATRRATRPACSSPGPTP